MIKKTLIRFFLVFLAACLFACTQGYDDCWDVLIKGRPSQIIPQRCYQNSVRNVLYQTHEPLLQNDKDVSYYSKILSSWEHNIDDTSFSFCLKPNLYFSQGVPFNAADLKDYFDQLFVRLHLSGKVELKTDSCVDLYLDRPHHSFSDTLSRYDLAPSHPSGNPDYEWGLGPYEITTFEKDQIVLKRKIPSKRGFNTIHFFDLEYLKAHPEIDQHSIEDFAKMPPEDTPDWVFKTYKKYFVQILQSMDLVINIPGENLRQVVYHCMDIQALRQKLSSGKFVDIKTILPLGFPGAQSGLPEQQCEEHLKNLQRKNVELVYYNWKGIDEEKLNPLFDAFYNKTGIRIIIRRGSSADFSRTVGKVPHPYQLYMTFLGTGNALMDPISSSVLGPDVTMVDFKLDGYDELYKKWSEELDVGEKHKLALKMADLIAQRAVVLPLSQDIRNYYYPKDIKGLNMSRMTVQTPNIADLYR